MVRIQISIEHIEGHCVVFEGHERIIIDGPEIDLEATDKICIHALAPLLHYVLALREGVSPRTLGLSRTDTEAYVACVDPGPPYTDGGRVIFKIERLG